MAAKQAKTEINSPVPVRMSLELKEKLRKEAEKDDRSMNYTIVKILEQHFEKPIKKKVK